MSSNSTESFLLQRFVQAQDQGQTYARALAELRAGRKTSHWMWFIFPQLAGLGHSEMSRTYAISSLAEAKAYLEHPVLGTRLRQCVRVLTGLGDHSATAVFGTIDAVKLRSSMTVFDRAASPREELFGRVLVDYFGAIADAETERLLGAS